MTRLIRAAGPAIFGGIHIQKSLHHLITIERA
jgi:hypothetical protein